VAKLLFLFRNLAAVWKLEGTINSF